MGTGKSSPTLAILRGLIAGIVIGAISIVFAVSFAAIVYAGPLAPFLDRGIGLTLVGAAIMAAVGAFCYSYRGNYAGPQDITAILLAGGAAQVASAAAFGGAEAVYATGVAFIAIATVIAGLTATILGTLRLSELSRYIPYPVLGGFLAATGLFLLLGAIGMVLREPIGILDVPSLFEPARLNTWLPWIAAGAAMVGLTRIFRSEYTLAALITLIGAAFYLVLAVSNTSLAEARSAGLLLGPFNEGNFVSYDRLPDLGLIEWGEFSGQALVIGAVVGTTIVGGLLNLSGLELVLKRNFDLDHDLKATGLSNIGGGLVGGLPGYPLIAEVTIASRMGLTTAIAGLVTAGACFFAAFFGARFIGVLPIGLFAAIVGYLGIDLLITWLWREPRRLASFDVSIIFITLSFAATIGLLQALAFGLIISVALFMLSYARSPVIRSVRTVGTRPSIVERDDEELEYLAVQGHSVQIFELTGYLFFGTASRIAERVATAEATTIILDFTRVSGIDASAVQSLNRLRQDCTSRGVEVVHAGLEPSLVVLVERFNQGKTDTARRYQTLDDAIEAAETTLLQGRSEPPPPVGDAVFLAELKRLSPRIDPIAEFSVMTVDEASSIVQQGDESKDIFVLLEGAARAEVDLGNDRRLTVAKFLPGALIGEIAFYSGGLRTAHVIADTRSRLLRIDPEQIAVLSAKDPAFPANFHQTAARFLSRRLGRATRALRAGA